MIFLCLFGDGFNLGLGLVMFSFRVEVLNGGFFGFILLGVVLFRFLEVGILWIWRDWVILYYIDRCNTCIGKRFVEIIVRMLVVVVFGRCVFKKF